MLLKVPPTFPKLQQKFHPIRNLYNFFLVKIFHFERESNLWRPIGAIVYLAARHNAEVSNGMKLNENHCAENIVLVIIKKKKEKRRGRKNIEKPIFKNFFLFFFLFCFSFFNFDIPSLGHNCIDMELKQINEVLSKLCVNYHRYITLCNETIMQYRKMFIRISACVHTQVCKRQLNILFCMNICV